MQYGGTDAYREHGGGWGGGSRGGWEEETLSGADRGTRIILHLSLENQPRCEWHKIG